MAAFLLKTTLPTSSEQSSRKETAMNPTTISNIPSRNLKAPYVSTIIGLALAVSAVLAFGPSASVSQTAVSSRRPSIPIATRSYVAPQHTFIIAANAAQQAEMESANSDLRSVDPQRNDITVLLAGSPAATSFLDEGARELMAIGVSFRIVDMTSVTLIVHSETGARASEADIAAAALSTELANFAAPALVSRPFSDGDVMDAILAGPPAGHSVLVP
jgi:hypothetical protein